MEKEKKEELESIRGDLENYILEYSKTYELEDLLTLVTVAQMLEDITPPEKENLH